MENSPEGTNPRTEDMFIPSESAKEWFQSKSKKVAEGNNQYQLIATTAQHIYSIQQKWTTTVDHILYYDVLHGNKIELIDSDGNVLQSGFRTVAGINWST